MYSIHCIMFFAVNTSHLILLCKLYTTLNCIWYIVLYTVFCIQYIVVSSKQFTSVSQTPPNNAPKDQLLS